MTRPREGVLSIVELLAQLIAVAEENTRRATEIETMAKRIKTMQDANETRGKGPDDAP